MKFSRIFLCFIWLFIGCERIQAQTDTAYLYQIYHSFSNAGKAEWTAFQNNRDYFNYSSLKQKYNIKELSCKSCESFYADIYIEIEAKGTISLATCIIVKRCGMVSTDPLLKKDFENSVKPQSFKYIKDKKFMMRFGHVLKC